MLLCHLILKVIRHFSRLRMSYLLHAALLLPYHALLLLVLNVIFFTNIQGLSMAFEICLVQKVLSFFFSMS
jgi:hypothetical protein